VPTSELEGLLGEGSADIEARVELVLARRGRLRVVGGHGE